MVINNDGSNFSVGANIGLMLFAAKLAVWDVIEDMLDQGQKTWKRLKQSKFPVVAAPFGMAIG